MSSTPIPPKKKKPRAVDNSVRSSGALDIHATRNETGTIELLLTMEASEPSGKVVRIGQYLTYDQVLTLENKVAAIRAAMLRDMRTRAEQPT